MGLSIVVVSFSDGRLLDRCLGALAAARGARLTEIVVVRAARGEPHEPAPAVREALPAVRSVVAPPGSTVPRMRSIGLQASRGEVVAFIEDDCLVAPDWIDAVLAAHGEAAAVGGAVEPGDYGRALDWSVFFCDYARFMLPFEAGPARAFTGNNMSFRRSELIRVAPDAAHELYEVAVHEALLRAGSPTCNDPHVVVRNVGAWALANVMRVPYHHGRAYAGRRLARQPALWRTIMSLLALLLPVLKVARVVREVVSRRRLIGPLVSSLPYIVLLSTSWSLGESVGYLRGPGGSPSKWR